MANTSPVEAVNTGDRYGDGQTVTIGPDNLVYGDAEQPDSEIVYTITRAVEAGTLALNGVPLAVGGSFTQDDIDEGRITYTGAGSQNVSFGFQVTDGAGGYVGGKSFSLNYGNNTAPVEVVNSRFTIAAGTTELITSDWLLYGDAEQPDSQITYTITQSPSGVSLSRGGVALGEGDSFTQADLDGGLVSLIAMSGGNGFFGFQVTDGQGGYVGGKQFNFSVATFPDTVIVNGMGPETGEVSPYVATSEPSVDLDNDGYADPYSGVFAGSTRNREFYFLYGEENGLPPVANYPAITVDQGFAVVNTRDYMIRSLAIGDINGDGFGDLAVSPIGHYSISGYVAVIFGQAGRPVGTLNEYNQDIINLENLAASDGFVLLGGAGSMMNLPSALGDINGDGIDDFAASAPNEARFYHGSGSIYVVYGTTGGFGPVVGGKTTVSAGDLTPSQGFVLTGPAYERINQITGIGDINGDGYNDMIVSSTQSYVIYGGAEGPGALVGGQRVLDLVNLSPEFGFVLDSTVAFGGAAAFANAGDLNSDGIDDLVIGSQGSAYVLFGSTGGFGNAPVDRRGREVVDLTLLDGSDGFIILSNEAGDDFGAAVRGNMDVNGDDIDDIQIDAPGAGGGAGATYTVYGRDSQSSSDGLSADLFRSGGDDRLLDLAPLDLPLGWPSVDLLA